MNFAVCEAVIRDAKVLTGKALYFITLLYNCACKMCFIFSCLLITTVVSLTLFSTLFYYLIIKGSLFNQQQLNVISIGRELQSLQIHIYLTIDVKKLVYLLFVSLL